MLHRRRPLLISALVAVALVTSLGLSSCSSDASDGAAPAKKTDGNVTQPDGDTTGGDATDGDAVKDQPGNDGGGTARITIGDETWEFDSVLCGFGEEETGVENAVFNMAARQGQISLYAADEDGRAYLELANLYTMDDGGLNWNSTGDVAFKVDGRKLSSTLDVVSLGDDGSQSDETAQFEADCS